jgi:hypothetical protein
MLSFMQAKCDAPSRGLNALGVVLAVGPVSCMRRLRLEDMWSLVMRSVVYFVAAPRRYKRSDSARGAARRTEVT